MLLDIKIRILISNQCGCLKGFFIFWEEIERNQINKLLLPPLSKQAVFIL